MKRGENHLSNSKSILGISPPTQGELLWLSHPIPSHPQQESLESAKRLCNESDHCSQESESGSCLSKSLKSSYDTHSNFTKFSDTGSNNTALVYLEIFKDEEATSLSAVVWKYLTLIDLSGCIRMPRRPDS